MQVLVCSFNDFQNAAKDAQVLVLASGLSFDHETVMSIAHRYVDREGFFLLESATAGPGNIARFSFLGFNPVWSMKTESGKNHFLATSYSSGVSESEASNIQNPFKFLEHKLSAQKLKVLAQEPIVTDNAGLLGCIGYFSYECAKYLEPSIGKTPKPGIAMPEAYVLLPRFFLVVDQLRRHLTIAVVCDVAGLEAKRLQPCYDQAVKDLQSIVKDLDQPHPLHKITITKDPLDFTKPESSFPKEKFLPAVARCLEEIRSGEIFQIQIGQRLSLPCAASPFDIFRHLRMLNPSPYMFYLSVPNAGVLLGASPEMMVQVQNGIVTQRPIAGTRKRTWDPEKDRRMRAELLASEKERAEHVMLVDLCRNDLGRIAQAGTVRVEDLMIVEEYSHVFHMVSQVKAQLKTGLSAFDALISGFPNGTVSGAPKIRAMQLINEIEKVGRDFYAGALGLFDFAGNMRSTILIRSIFVKDGIASTQASAGIVYDSVPEHEWQETYNKMAACLTAIQNTRTF